jgi:hypothetical protein
MDVINTATKALSAGLTEGKSNLIKYGIPLAAGAALIAVATVFIGLRK